MLQTLFSRCNITYFAETKHEEINNWKSNDYRREKRCHFTPFYFIRLSVIRLNSRAVKINRILSWLARISRGCPARKKNLFWPWNNPSSLVWVNKNANIRQEESLGRQKTGNRICLFFDRENKNFKRRKSLNIVILGPKSFRAFIQL